MAKRHPKMSPNSLRTIVKKCKNKHIYYFQYNIRLKR